MSDLLKKGEAPKESVPTYLRPVQVDEMKRDKENLEGQLRNPHIQDKASVARQLSGVNRQLETQTPQPFPEEVGDKAAARINELRERIREDMPTQAEMRKAPPGAVNKELAFQQKHKQNIQEYKALMLRQNAGTDDNEVASIERFRPEGGSGEMNMDNALIAGTNYNFGAPVPPAVNVMTDEEREAALADKEELRQVMEGLNKINPARRRAIESELAKAAAAD
jgi:hypothetical protein